MFSESNSITIYDCKRCNFKGCLEGETICDDCLNNKCSSRLRAICKNNDCWVCFNKSFASHPKAKFWDYEKNKENPRDISKGSNEKYWFNCNDCKHSFNIGLNKITSRNQWCAYCSKRKRCDKEDCIHCFKNSFASHPKAEFVKDKTIDLRKISKSTVDIKLTFVCNICKHDFDSNMNNITKGKWCPFCSNQKRCVDKDCQLCFKNSFASHPSSKFVKDKTIDLRQYAISSEEYLEFICPTCNHTFTKIISSINIDNCGCPYCSNQKRCIDKDCQLCFKNSFASHPSSKFVKDKTIDLRKIAISSKQKLEFICPTCNHVFESVLNNLNNNNTGCPYCVNIKRCDKEDCEHCLKKSFASHPKAEFVKDKTIDLRKIAISSKQKLEFICPTCNNEFSSALGHISSGKWCPHCLNKTETKLYEYLLTLNINITRQFKTDFCKNEYTGKHLPYDFEINSKKVIIELDGRQHFTQVSDWESPENTTERDVYKMKCAVNNGYKVIRLLQEEVFEDKFKWKTELKKVLDNIENEENVVYITPDTTIYNTHIELYKNNLK